MADLKRLVVERKNGNECFNINGQDVDFDIKSFWQWSASDLVSNASRGRLAEYIVARALGLGIQGVRDEWAPYDLETQSGIKIEVKSAAYVQSWNQKRLSTIQFVIPKTHAWDADTGIMELDAKRQADIYVFALLFHKEKETIDPLNLDQWKFYLVPTAILDGRSRSQHSITLASLENLCCGAVTYDDVQKAFDECISEMLAQQKIQQIAKGTTADLKS